MAKIGYMCRIDFDHHMGNDPKGVEIYPTVGDLRDHHPCADECGIVEVEVTIKQVVEKSKF